jgi:O-antigen/teichoic acid export membrane protein
MGTPVLDTQPQLEPQDNAGGGVKAQSVEELTELTAGGLPWMATSRVASELVLMISMVVLARLIAPSDFGAFAVALIVAGLAINIPGAGVGTSLVQRDDATREHLQAGGALALIAALFFGGLTWLISYVVIGPVVGGPAADLVRLASPLFLLSGVGTVSTALLQRRLDFRRLAAMEIIGNVVRAAVSLSMAIFAGLGGTALVAGMLAGTAATSAIAIAGAMAPLPRWRLRAARDLAGFGLPASIAAIAWTGFANGDYAVIAARLGTGAAGQYWRAYTLAVSYQAKISVLMQTVAFPVLSRSATVEDLLALRRRMIRVLTVTLFPLLVGLAITAPVVVPAVYGGQWKSAILPTQILCAGGASTLVIDAIGAVLMATGRARGLLGYGAAHFVVYIGCVVIVSPLGLVAVAITGAIVHGAFAVVAYGMIARREGQNALSAIWEDLAPASLSCLGMAVLAVPIDLLVQAGHLPGGARFIIVFIVCALGYLLTLRIAFIDSWRDLHVLGRRLIPTRLVPAPIRARRRRAAA